MGFNTIRLPFSLQALDSDVPITGPDFSGGKNAALQGKTPQQAMDVVIDAAARAGLMVLLENHSLADDGYSYGLWYGQAGYDENDWVARWQALARRYSDKPNVIGADLKNEPHGDATWGTGGPTDWQPRGHAGGQRGHRARAELAHRRRGDREARRRRPARHALVGRQPRGRAPAPGAAAARRTASSTRRTSTAPASSRSRGSVAPTRRSSSSERWRDGWGFIAEQGHRAAADRRVRRPQGRPRQRRGPLAASVPRPPRADGHLLDLLGAESRLGRHRRRPLRRLDDAGRRQARPAAAHDAAVSASARRRSRASRTPPPPRSQSQPRPEGQNGLKAAVVVENRWATGWCGHLEVTGNGRRRTSPTPRSASRCLPGPGSPRPGTASSRRWRVACAWACPRGRARRMTATGFCVSGTGAASDVRVG